MPLNLARLKGESLKYFFKHSSDNVPIHWLKNSVFRVMGVNSISVVRFAEPVPGANILAGIATKHPVVKFPFHLARYQLIF